MGGRAVHLKAAGSKPTGRAAIWEAIRDLRGREFTAREVADNSDVPFRTVQDYMHDLTAAGHLERRGRGPQAGSSQTGIRYALVRDVGVEAPRVRRDGSPATAGAVHEALWRTMRILKEFGVRDLATTASTDDTPVADGTAEKYATLLHKAGYLVAAERGPKGGIAVRWRLIDSRYTGPKPPVIQKIKQVFDPNTGAVVWSSRPEESSDE